MSLNLNQLKLIQLVETWKNHEYLKIYNKMWTFLMELLVVIVDVKVD